VAPYFHLRFCSLTIAHCGSSTQVHTCLVCCWDIWLCLWCVCMCHTGRSAPVYCPLEAKFFYCGFVHWVARVSEQRLSSTGSRLLQSQGCVELVQNSRSRGGSLLYHSLCPSINLNRKHMCTKMFGSCVGVCSCVCLVCVCVLLDEAL